MAIDFTETLKASIAYETSRRHLPPCPVRPADKDRPMGLGGTPCPLPPRVDTATAGEYEPEPFESDFGAGSPPTLNNLPAAMDAAHAVQSAEDRDAETQAELEWAGSLLRAAAGEGASVLLRRCNVHWHGPGEAAHWTTNRVEYSAYVVTGSGDGERRGHATADDAGESARLALLDWRGAVEKAGE